jgi:hypothetical protein
MITYTQKLGTTKAQKAHEGEKTNLLPPVPLCAFVFLCGFFLILRLNFELLEKTGFA